MLCVYVAKFIKITKNGLESSKFKKLNIKHFQ